MPLQKLSDYHAKEKFQNSSVEIYSVRRQLLDLKNEIAKNANKTMLQNSKILRLAKRPIAKTP